MKKILITSVACIALLSGCTEDSTKTARESGLYVQPIKDGYFIVDERTGCLMGSKSPNVSSGSFNVLGLDGKPVGCRQAGGMTVEEYFALERKY